MTRRSLLRWALALPAFTALWVRGLTDRVAAAATGGSSIDVYRALGVRPDALLADNDLSGKAEHT